MREIKLKRGKQLRVNKGLNKLKKGKRLGVRVEEKEEEVLEVGLRVGKKLSLRGRVVEKGGVERGVKKVEVKLRRGKKLVIKKVKEDKGKKVGVKEVVKGVIQEGIEEIVESGVIEEIIEGKKERGVKLEEKREVVGEVIQESIEEIVEKVKGVSKDDEKEEKTKPLEGEGIYEYLKRNKSNRTREEVLKWYKAKDLNTLIKSGKVFEKRGKLII